MPNAPSIPSLFSFLAAMPGVVCLACSKAPAQPDWLSPPPRTITAESIHQEAPVPAGDLSEPPSNEAGEWANVHSLQTDTAIRAAPPCARDTECGYDPESGRCGSDPSFNHQPPLRDQGILCYCDTDKLQCERLEIKPIPCEGDGDCGIALTPRPHPALQSAGHPGRTACNEGIQYKGTCERTNICTMNRVPCGAKTHNHLSRP